MRVFGRVTNPNGTQSWVQVDTDANGENDGVYVTALAQCLKLNLGESPFYADHGIPAHASVIQQIFPDFYVTRTQFQYAPYFASLSVRKVNNVSNPQYDINVITNNGSKIMATIPT